MEVRGEVRRLSDAFGEGEVQKASLLLQSIVDTHRRTFRTLETFLHDNQQLSKLVQELPTKVSHPVMVPFGKAAFFPGKLVHTNEFLVLLGEGYYAECSAYKTLEILDRRSKMLSSQISGVKSQLADLDVESRFFKETLVEATAGCVEIKEEFIEPGSSGSALMASHVGLHSEGSSSKAVEEVLTDEDKEHERLMARLNELEAAEAAAEMNSSPQRDYSSFSSPVAFNPLDGEHGFSLADIESETLKKEVKLNHFKEDEQPQGMLNKEITRTEESAQVRKDEGCPSLKSPGDLLKFEEWRRSKSMKGNSNQSPELKMESLMLSSTRQEIQERVMNSESTKQVASMLQTQQPQSSATSMNKVFTGSVVERNVTITPAQTSETTKQSQRRPASKFKMRQADK